MGKLHDVISFEVRRTVRKKSFWYTSFAPPLIILVVFGISYYSDNASANKTQTTPAGTKIGVLDESGFINKAALPKEHLTPEPTRQAGIAAVKSGQLNAFFYYPADVTSAGIQISAKDQGLTTTPPYDTLAVGLLDQDITAKINTAVHNPVALKLLLNNPPTQTTTYKNGAETNGAASIIAPGLFMIAFLALVVLLASTMIASTTQEKENRVAEILLTAIRGRTLIVGKIISIFILGGIQIVAIAIPLLLAYARFKQKINLPGNVTLSQIPLNPTQIGLGLVFLMLGLAIFTGLMVGLGAMFPSAADGSRFLGLGIISAFLPIYAIGSIVTSPHSLIVTVFSYFPLTAATMGLLRNTIGSISLTEALPIIAELIASAILATMFAIRAFRYGSMEYGRRVGLKELFR